ncbi:MAG: septal ring lytic transglycosylase RlpA family protein [Desulfovibrio sp.]
MRRTVRQMRTAAYVLCCIVLLASLGCVQKQRIYSEPARYDHGPAEQSASSAPEQAGRQSATLAVQEQELADQQPTAKTAPKPAPAASAVVESASEADGEVGLASWVADDFHGLRTASGELYDKDALTASHRTLPMNTRVEVTNLENGRYTVVRINDRGPFKQDRIIDVSHRAADELGMIASGLVKVRLRVLDGQGAPSAPSTATQETTPPASDVESKTGTVFPQAVKTQPGGSWYVQVGAFQDRENAKQVLAGLYTAGYGQSRISRNQDDGFYRVQAGSFASRLDAEAALEALKPQFPAGYVINSGSVQP